MSKLWLRLSISHKATNEEVVEKAFGVELRLNLEPGDLPPQCVVTSEIVRSNAGCLVGVVRSRPRREA